MMPPAPTLYPVRHAGVQGAGGGERIAILDVIRGAAVLAILSVNIFSFALPDVAALTPYWRDGGASETWAYVANYILADGKFRGLFTLLFGAGIAMIMDRSAAQGLPPTGLHRRRMFWLALIGAGHMVLIWHGDILLSYALCGLLITIMPLPQSARPLVIGGAALLLIGAALLAWMSFFSSPHMAAHIPFLRDQPAMMMDMILRHDEEMAALGSDIAADLALYRGPYGPIMAYRIDFLIAYPASFLIGALETLPLMLIGMGLYRSGFLTGALSGTTYRRTLWIGLPLGLALTALSLWPLAASDYDPLVGLAALISFSVPGRLALMLAYAALLILLARRWADSRLSRRLAAAGRMALSNYLASSLMMTSIFYGYGLGLFGQWDRWGLYGFVVMGAALMLLWSQPWLARFHYGPAEWLWRSLARGERQPFVKG